MPTWFVEGEQQDSSEYMRFLLDSIHEETDKVNRQLTLQSDQKLLGEGNLHSWHSVSFLLTPESCTDWLSYFVSISFAKFSFWSLHFMLAHVLILSLDYTC